MGSLWLVFFALFGVISGLESGETGGCPKSCSCSVVGVTQLVAACSRFNATQRFDDSTGKLVIENASGLVLSDNIFQTVGLSELHSITIRSSVFQRLDSKAFNGLQSLSFVKLEGNNRMVLSSDMFTTNTDLVQVSIRHSRLAFGDKELFLFDNPSVTELELVNCDVASLLNADSFSRMPLLQYINLASNMIRHVEPMFSNLTDLEQVDLSDNLISEIQPDLFAHTDLDILVLRKNALSTVKGLNVPRLTDLDLSLCKFSKIDGEMFTGVPMLVRLNLSGNAISEIDANAFSELVDLIHLDLSHNALKGPLMVDLFSGNQALQIISFAHNPSLRVLPAQLFRGLSDVFSIDLSFCGLKSLDQGLFSGMTALTTLNLAGNVLQEIQPFTLTASIINLDLSHNKITDLDLVNFTSGSSIETLSLANNKLKEVATSHFKDLEFLRVLNLNSCGLRNMWVNKNEKAVVLKSLTTLLMAKNSIQQILPRLLQLTPRLHNLDISDNRLVCDAGFQASLKWLEDRHVKHSSVFEPRSGEVLSGHPYGNDAIAHSNPLDTAEKGEAINLQSWKWIEAVVCGFEPDNKLEPIRKDPEDQYDDGNEEEEEDEEEDEDDDDDYVLDKTRRPHDIEIKQMSIEEEFDKVDLWPIAIVAISGVVILLFLSVLSCFALRWHRQRNSYGAAMIKHHLNTPRLRRDGSPIYQQLHEDLNSPTTPVMSIKLGNSEYSKIAPQSV
ncbi:insulin-like growth factor-binding protein complex acid labile subunit [Anabrus simplex]|uniref:insulin-like growth factor-binding protein complex acid labile subunit n=1 Tax=Anabrus simplex TaxID=316456 RepID=UPI0034DCE7DE